MTLLLFINKKKLQLIMKMCLNIVQNKKAIGAFRYEAQVILEKKGAALEEEKKIKSSMKDFKFDILTEEQKKDDNAFFIS